METEPSITPEEFLKRRKLSVATYFSLVLGFSFPVLKVLLFQIDPEEEVVLRSIEHGRLTEEVKGRWIYDSQKDRDIESRWRFIFSEPRTVFVDNDVFYTPRVGMPIWIMGQKILSNGDKDTVYRWCLLAPKKIKHFSEIGE